MQRIRAVSGFPRSCGWVLIMASICMAGSSRGCGGKLRAWFSQMQERNRADTDYSYGANPGGSHGIPKDACPEISQEADPQMVGRGDGAQRRAGSGEGRLQIEQCRGDRKIPE